MPDYDAVLLDIEGTTTPIRFVYDVLFPYARRCVRLEHLDLEAFRQQALADGEAPPESEEEALRNALRYMDGDRKVTCLKAMQGRIWREGYESGDLRSEVFPDVPPALRRWKDRGCRTAIFSSGSVEAQRLLFGATPFGDLTGDLDAWFDTTTGPKHEARSYASIAGALGVAPERVLFLTDAVAEARAASAAGMQVRLMRRPGNPAVEPHPFREEQDFDGL